MRWEMFCGVDEAGRGPVLGPLVVASVAVDDDTFLRELGVKDSKMLSPRRRSALFGEIVSNCEHAVVVRMSHEIDAARMTMSLNDLELLMFQEAISSHAVVKEAFVDCADVNEESFGRRLGSGLSPELVIHSRHKADSLFPVVSAASIVAKVTRDRMMEELSQEWGVDLGSGYPSDPKTIGFLENWINDKGNPPSCARSSWETTRRLLERRKLTRITDW